MNAAVATGFELANPLWLLLLLALPPLVVGHHRRPPADALTYSGLPVAGLPRSAWRWALQTFLIGFPSLRLLLRAAG